MKRQPVIHLRSAANVRRYERAQRDYIKAVQKHAIAEYDVACARSQELTLTEYEAMFARAQALGVLEEFVELFGSRETP